MSSAVTATVLHLLLGGLGFIERILDPRLQPLGV
jgi:hypothetical protein